MHITQINLYIEDINSYEWNAISPEIAICRFNNEIFDILRFYAHSEEDMEYIKEYNYNSSKKFTLDSTNFRVVTLTFRVETEFPIYSINLYRNNELEHTWCGSNIRTLIKFVNSELKCITENSQWQHIYEIEYSKHIHSEFIIGEDVYKIIADF